MAAIAATLVILAAIPVALYRIRRSGLPTDRQVAGLVVAGWVALLPLRFTAGGQETANRSADFLYVGIAICFAFLLEPIPRFVPMAANTGTGSRHPAVRGRHLGFVELLAAAGAGLPADERLRGRDSRRSGARPWMLATLGPGHRVATDSQTGLALGSAGRQDVLVLGRGQFADLADLLPADRHRRRTGRDTTISDPIRGRAAGRARPADRATRFDDSEPAQYYNSPLPAASLSKFDTSPVFREIYAAGSLAFVPGRRA